MMKRSAKFLDSITYKNGLMIFCNILNFWFWFLNDYPDIQFFGRIAIGKQNLHELHVRMYFITGNTLCSTTWYLSWKCKFKLDSTSCVYSFYPLSWLYVREVCDGRTSFVKRGILSAKSYFSTLPTHPEMKAQVSQKAEHVKRNHGNSVTQNSNPVSMIKSSTLEDVNCHMEFQKLTTNPVDWSLLCQMSVLSLSFVLLNGSRSFLQ